MLTTWKRSQGVILRGRATPGNGEPTRRKSEVSNLPLTRNNGKSVKLQKE